MYEQNSELLKIVPLIAKVVEGKTLRTTESEKAFSAIFRYDTQGFYMLSLISALHARRETAEELAGLVSANTKLATKLSLPLNKKNKILSRITDLSGSGGSLIKTFNVSTTASFIVAAADLYVLKNSYWAVTGLTGSADIFEELGIQFNNLTVDNITKFLLKTHIAPICIPLISPNLQNRANVLKKIFKEQGLKIKTPFHIVSNIVTALPMKNRIYGIYSPEYLDIIGNLFIHLNYDHTLTFYGEPGLPEVSNVGKTYVVEQRGRFLEKYILMPEDLGVKKTDPADIQTHSRKENIRTFINILSGKETGAKADLAFINAGASLYVMGKAKSIKEGVLKARELVVSGRAKEVLERFGYGFNGFLIKNKYLNPLK